MNEIMTQEQVVTDAMIGDYLKSLGNKLDDKDRQRFIQISKAFNLNPFIREIYGIPYGNNFNIIVGYEVYLKRAERSGTLEGWRAWTDGEGKAMKGCVEIARKGWTKPFYHEVYLEEYDQNNSMWKSKPRTMIKKVAIAQGFRMAFPAELGGIPHTVEEEANAVIVVDAPTMKPVTEPPKARAKQDFAVEIAAITSTAALTDWYKANAPHIESLPAEEQSRIIDLCAKRKADITGAVMVECQERGEAVMVAFCDDCEKRGGCPSHD